MLSSLRPLGGLLAVSLVAIACGSAGDVVSAGGVSTGGCAAAGCSSSTGAALANEAVIRFVHYNDLHAHLVPPTTFVMEPGDTTPRVAMRGGVARLATTIKKLRAENPASVLMNVGDTYHGGVEALYTQGEAIAPIVNALGIDVGVPGNWDYAYGPQVTRGRYTGDMLAGMQE